MIVDVPSIVSLFAAEPFDSALASRVATSAVSAHDYGVLGALALHRQPERVFEIGTYRGATSQFLLDLLPSVHVVSIATLDATFNNSNLLGPEVGELVRDRDRFTQIIGDSHEIDAFAFVKQYGRMDFVFVDGDHTQAGVLLDSLLAREILSDDGIIVWHDASHPRHRGVAIALRELPFVVAREGNVACWSPLAMRNLVGV